MIKVSIEWAKPHKIEVKVKIDMPKINIFFLPKISATLPNGSRSCRGQKIAADHPTEKESAAVKLVSNGGYGQIDGTAHKRG